MPEAPLSLCDVEPIHSPGLVQPHGILLALQRRRDTLAIIAASANAGCEPATSPAAYLDADAQALLEQAMAAGTAASDLPLGILRDAHDREWDATLRRDGTDHALLELEPVAPAASDPRRLLERLNRGLAAIQLQTEHAVACRAAVAAVSEVSGFDRVMAYRLLEGSSGEVIAETLQPGATQPAEGRPDSYLGLRFPASDIPVQARALYNSAAIRLIPDARAEPVPLLRLDGSDAAVDLSRAVLRGVAPVHLTYLANMGVRASMSIAIRDGKGGLWGLFACHHLQEPLHVGPEVRLAAEILARALSWRLSELDAAIVETRLARLRAVAPALLADLVPALPAAAGTAVQPDLATAAAVALGACEATAIAACPRTPGLEPTRLGAAPGDAALVLLCTWLDDRAAADSPASDRSASAGCRLRTNALPGMLPPSLASVLLMGDVPVCGLLAIRLPGAGWLLLLRPGLRRVVIWAGNPDKAGGAGPDPLSPRASFAAWTQEVDGLSEPWSEADVTVALALRDMIGEALLDRAAGIARGNEELRRRSEETRFFADAAAHDLSEPLWQIQVLSEVIGEGLEDLPADLPPPPAMVADLRQMTQSVLGSATRMQAMIAELSRLAVAGHQADRSQRVALREVAAEALEDIRQGPPQTREPAAAALAGASIVLDGLDGIVLHADRAQVRRVFQNLFSNAIKYRDPERPLTVVFEASQSPGGPGADRIVQVEVVDNGVGFDPAHAPRLFEPFRRFPNRAAAATPGLGLGLAICQRIVAVHGGTITASVPASGTGARFRFTLVEPDPAKLEEAAGAPDSARTLGDAA
nr:ATP-binding protein [uncultured Lichenicoccus sp.]